MWTIQFIFLLVIFVGGMYFYGKYTNPKILENIEERTKPRCPNLLVQVDSKYYLYNTNLDKIPGVNPIEFSNLEDYTTFVKWQQNVGVKCPVLYVQNTYDAQGNRVYKIRPDVLELQGGLPPVSNASINTVSHDTHTINNTLPILSTRYEGSPSKNKEKNDAVVNDSKTSKLIPQNVEYPGSLAPLPVPTFSSKTDDPMDVNWGGPDFTEKSIASGKYAENEVLYY
jgi:hypothetical protein